MQLYFRSVESVLAAVLIQETSKAVIGGGPANCLLVFIIEVTTKKCSITILRTVVETKFW